ncbi:hypothetical protein NE237_027132 [Protea cynaroides]|uniref:Uncharacterized protein n=1 Tax=Protea cynaroides TaxID=273540 RepID=A0A9Q0JTX5_9MAGN|nr:hypothetical protein NE237_027132 [Protea cynaroides]
MKDRHDEPIEENEETEHEDCQLNNDMIMTLANCIEETEHEDCQSNNDEIRILGKSNVEIEEIGYEDCQSNNDEVDETEPEDCELNDIEITIVEAIQKKLGVVHSMQSAYDIYRVPNQHHKLRPEAYTPQSVSIDPLHHNEEHLKPMEAHKLRYLNDLLKDSKSGATLDVYVKTMSKLAEKARKCYSETMGFGKDEFVNMMVMDGCFILVLLKKLEAREADYLLFPTRQREIATDLIKLENQLPFFVIEHLHDLIFGRPEQPQEPSSHHILTHRKYTASHHILTWLLLIAQGFHTLDMSPNRVKSFVLPQGGAKHFLDLLRCALIPASPRKKRPGGMLLLTTPMCATELKRAGIRFKNNKSQTSQLKWAGVRFKIKKSHPSSVISLT